MIYTEHLTLFAEPGAARVLRTGLLSSDRSSKGGWHRASAAYANYLRQHQGQHVLFLEIGVGSNTPVIIKYPFWQMTNDNPNAVYCCLNYDEAYCPKQIEARSICIDGDTGTLLISELAVPADYGC